MKHLLPLVLVSLVAVPVANAQSTTQKPSTAPVTRKATPVASKASKPVSKSRIISAEFVSYDATAKTITVKDSKGQTMSEPLEGRAMTEVARLKSGEKLTVTVRDNDKGEHQAITNIRPAKTKKA